MRHPELSLLNNKLNKSKSLYDKVHSQGIARTVKKTFQFFLGLTLCNPQSLDLLDICFFCFNKHLYSLSGLYEWHKLHFLHVKNVQEHDHEMVDV